MTMYQTRIFNPYSVKWEYGGIDMITRSSIYIIRANEIMQWIESREDGWKKLNSDDIPIILYGHVYTLTKEVETMFLLRWS